MTLAERRQRHAHRKQEAIKLFKQRNGDIHMNELGKQIGVNYETASRYIGQWLKAKQHEKENREQA